MTNGDDNAAPEPQQEYSPELFPEPAEKSALPKALLGAFLLAAVVIGGLVLMTRDSRPVVAPPPTGQALAYLRDQISVADLHLSTAPNFLGQDVVYLDGSITNHGSQRVTRLRIRLYFYDYASQPVLQEEQDIVRSDSPPLAPGESREFQLRSDSVPDGWNMQLPQFQIVSLQLD